MNSHGLSASILFTLVTLVRFTFTVSTGDEHDCIWTAPDGSKFDLTPLKRKAGDGDFVATDPNNKYEILNGNACSQQCTNA